MGGGSLRANLKIGDLGHYGRGGEVVIPVGSGGEGKGNGQLKDKGVFAQNAILF